MKNRIVKMLLVPLCGMALYPALGQSTTTMAQEGLEPMSGTGGVMRDAERRALAPLPSREADKLPDVKPAKQAEDPRLKAAAEKVLGPIEGVTVFGSREFAEREDVAGRIKTELDAKGEGDRTVGDVSEVLAKVRQDLMSKGFYLVRLSLARKNTYDENTHFLSVLVDEGRFGTISVKFADESDEGTWYSRKQVMKRFRYLKEGDTFDYTRLRSALFDAHAHPDLTIDTSIDVRKPIEGEGNDRRIARYADLDMTVRESMPFHAVWEVNNFGMEEVEEWQTSLTLQDLNLTKHDDVLTISPAMSFGAELKSVAASYMLPHTWWRGGNTTVYGGWSDLDVDNIVPRLDLEGSGWFMGLQHSEYLYETDAHLWAVSLGLLWRYIEDQYTALSQRLDKRQTSILPVSAALSYTGKKADRMGGRNFATVQGLVNIASSGDDLDEMWTGAEERYWILRGQLARLQPLFGWYDEKTGKDLHQWMLFLKLEGQYTTENLIPVEKLSLGGYNTMRGYRTRGYIGDYGVYGTAELRTPILVDGIASLFGDRTEKTPIDRLQGLCFLDYGWTAFNDLPSGYDDNEFLCSGGFGARAALTKYSQLRCDIAFPFANAYGDDDSMEIYLSVQVQF